MRVVCISDTHEFHDQVVVPDGDVLVHAGDMTFQGREEKVETFVNWMTKLPHKHKVLVAGNHDWLFEKRPRAAAPIFYATGINYLEDSGCEIEGLKFWGSPVQPWFLDWAFNRQRGAEIKKHWDLIPQGTDVLITHGPPLGILDQSLPGFSDHLGCEELALAVERIKPRCHIFGHIHGGYGIHQYTHRTYVNASVVNEAYKVVNNPIVVEI